MPEEELVTYKGPINYLLTVQNPKSQSTLVRIFLTLLGLREVDQA